MVITELATIELSNYLINTSQFSFQTELLGMREERLGGILEERG